VETVPGSIGYLCRIEENNRSWAFLEGVFPAHSFRCLTLAGHLGFFDIAHRHSHTVPPAGILHGQRGLIFRSLASLVRPQSLEANLRDNQGYPADQI
jgi:hypothetical protein